MRRIAWYGAVVGAVAMLSVSEAASQESTDLPVIGQVKSATGYLGDVGTLTAILRSVEVVGRTMTIKFAVRWDSADPSKIAGYRIYDLNWNVEDLSATDTTNLMAYRPLCTKGSYKSNVSDDVYLCSRSQLSWPNRDFKLKSGGFVEGSAVLPAPEGRPATVTVSLGAPLSSFTAVPVSYR